MKKNILRKLVSPLTTMSALLYLIALCIGITEGMVSYVLLLMAACAMTIVIIEAIVNQRSFVAWVYRFVAFFICWAGVFANQKEPVLEGVCALISMAGIIILVGHFVYYMNMQNVRDADRRLNY